MSCGQMRCCPVRPARGPHPLRTVAALLTLVSGLAGCGSGSETPGAQPGRASTKVAASPVAGGRPPNIVLITVESLRTDHVGVYGGKSHSRPEVPLTPALDALAKEGVLYEDAHSVTSWTLASHASLFTGLYPTAHQTRHATDRLDDSYKTIAEFLNDRGYDTAGVISGPYLRKVHNLSQGFAHYHDEIASTTHVQAHGEVTNPRLEETLRGVVENELDPSRPFLLFAYFWDNHYDYIPPGPYKTMFEGPDCEEIDVRNYETASIVNDSISPKKLAYVLSQYAGEVRWTDDHLGRFFQLLRDKGLWDNTVIIVTADHGEEFFDHGEKGHFNNVYAETVHVPLVVKYAKGGKAGRDTRLVSLVDILPTILDLTGAPSTNPLDGQSLLQPDPLGGRAIYQELLSVRRLPNPASVMFPTTTRTRNWIAVRQGDYKLVESPELGRKELYDVRKDPREKADLSQANAGVVEGLEAKLSSWQEEERRIAGTYQKGGTAKLTPAETERLRALGYLR